MEFSFDNASLQKEVEQWLIWDKNDVTRGEIEDLVKQNAETELKKRLCTRMEFGTAGLRARMGAGNSQMNDLTIIQTTQGFCKYMLVTTPHVTEKGVVIGYDARHNSQRFAWLAATVLMSQNIPVYLFHQICPTPYVPYSVRVLGATWGIMVTASHNPKEDNGYKVYFENGAQIISPHDKGIASNIVKNLEPWPSSWETGIVESSELRRNPFSEMHEGYMRDVVKVCYHRAKNQDSPLRFTYTAMHGVGYQFIEAAFKACNFRPCIPVKEQVEPDPEFPTVKFPNPEEGKSALDLAMRTADENHSTVILANDPDADRLALAEKQSTGGWWVPTGDQIGALLCWWRLLMYKETHATYHGSDIYTLASTVSSKILKSISRKEGFNFVETLTGFKWMGNESHRLLQQNKTVLFAFEEAIGFMCGTTVLDKDGISAAVVCAEMASWLAEKGISLKQQLENIYERYGYHVSSNSYFICHDKDVINAMFERIRNYQGTGKYPESCGPFRILHIRDLTTGYDNSQPDNRAILPVSKSSHMITFTFENGCIATIRTSGTEPKIKYYTEFCADPEKGQSREVVTEELQKMVDCIIKHFYEPERNNLIPRPL